MPELNKLQHAVDEGATAKHQYWRSILHYLIKKESGLYVRQREGYINGRGERVVETRTRFYPTWGLLLDSFENTVYGISDEWTVTSEPLEPYEQTPSSLLP